MFPVALKIKTLGMCLVMMIAISTIASQQTADFDSALERYIANSNDDGYIRLTPEWAAKNRGMLRMTVSSAFGGQSCFVFTLNFDGENLCETTIEVLGEPEKFPLTIASKGGGTVLFGTAHRETAPSKDVKVILNLPSFEAKTDVIVRISAVEIAALAAELKHKPTASEIAEAISYGPHKKYVFRLSDFNKPDVDYSMLGSPVNK